MYKVEKPQGAPEWFQSGIICKAGFQTLTIDKVVIVWYAKGIMAPYLDEYGERWEWAEPIESWEPVEGEWVAAWNDVDCAFVISQYRYLAESGMYYTDAGYCYHIARITDGLDLRCTPEKLKERTEWI